MSAVTVYTKPGCVSCVDTTTLMDELGIEYSKVDISTNSEARLRLKAMGFRGAPVVETDEANWGGFNEPAIRELATGVSAWDF